MRAAAARPPRHGFALALVLVAFGLVAVGVGMLWSQADSMQRLGRRTLAAEQARLLARGGLAHGLHKLERTIGYLDETLRGRAGEPLDLGRELPGYLAECDGKVSLSGGAGSWRLVGLRLARRETTRGGAVLEVSLEAEAEVRLGDEVRVERQAGEFRLYPGPTGAAPPPEPGPGGTGDPAPGGESP